MMRLAGHLFVFTALTVITQVGGLAYVLARIARGFVNTSRRTVFLSSAFFIVAYIGVSALTYVIAPLFGRTALPCLITDTAKLAMQSPFYCVLNRHYVTPKLKRVAQNLANYMDKEFPGTVTLALDANFPFLDGFPLLPHRSHDDGRKLDLAFYYRDDQGNYVRGQTKSPIGYWAFEQRRGPSRVICAKQTGVMSLRWDVPWFRPLLYNYRLDEIRTRAALRWLTTAGPRLGVTKIFLEPHLARTLKIHGSVLRFQGCNAARHDDHIHMQILG